MTATVDLRARRLNAFLEPGNPARIPLTWPAGSLTGRTFTSTLNGQAVTVEIAGDIMTIAVSAAAATALTVGDIVPWQLVDTTGADPVRLLAGRWVASANPTDTIGQAFTIVLDDDTTVEVDVDGAAALAAHELDDEAHGNPLGALAGHEGLAVAGAGAHGHVEHSWVRDGWGPLTEVIATQHGAQAFDLTVVAGRGRATSQPGVASASHRVWYLHPATSWPRARVTTTFWGPSTWTATPNRPQLGLVLGAQRPDPVGAPGRWVAFVVWTNIIGVDATPAGLLANGWDITGTTVTLGNGGGAGAGIAAVNRQAVVIKAEHLSFLGSELSIMRVTPPWAAIIAPGTPFALAGMEDPDYDIAAGVVGGASAGDINITAELDAAPANPADNIAGGLLVPDQPWDVCPYRIAAERTGPATIRVAQWAYGSPQPDEGDPRWTSVTVTQGAMGAFPTDAPGLHGIVVAHAHTGSYGEVGDLTFEQR